MAHTRVRERTARLFAAVDPPLDVCEELTEWARVAVRSLGLRSGASSPVRVLDPELLHVTVCFLGDRPVDEIGLIEGALAECATCVGELHVGAPLWLPRRRPRALAVEVRDGLAGAGGGTGSGVGGAGDHTESLAALHDELIQALGRACGFAEEQRRRFRAHVTVARIRGARGKSREHEPLPATPAVSFMPRALVLYRSHLSSEGASYEALSSHTLTPA